MGKNKPATQKDLLELADLILAGVQGMLDSSVVEIQSGQKKLQRQLDQLKYDVPTQREFDKVKRKVDRYLPPM
jgi:hypothetical protein